MAGRDLAKVEAGVRFSLTALNKVKEVRASKLLCLRGKSNARIIFREHAE